jgi:hypothetical protein
MRSIFAAIASLLMIAVGCSTVDPDQCWPNTSGGLGGGDPIPIGAGVGATTTGDAFAPPPEHPQTDSPKPNPCVTQESPPQSTCADGSSAAVTCGNFSSSLFKFVTIIPDDGMDKGGGWQQALVNLKYVRMLPPEGSWVCTFTVGMPLRSEADGVISPDYAASITAGVINDAWTKVRNDLPDAPGGIFCASFKTETTTLFAKRYPKTGIKVMP